MAGGMHGLGGGVHGLGHVWLGGMHGWGNAWLGKGCVWQGRCVCVPGLGVHGLGGGVCRWGACVAKRCAWLGACVAGGMHWGPLAEHPSVWLASGRYASYWNAVLFLECFLFSLNIFRPLMTANFHV